MRRSLVIIAVLSTLSTSSALHAQRCVEQLGDSAQGDSAQHDAFRHAEVVDIGMVSNQPEDRHRRLLKLKSDDWVITCRLDQQREADAFERGQSAEIRQDGQHLRIRAKNFDGTLPIVCIAKVRIVE
jgi:hypothetical protein